ncbi:MAG: DUF2188 domain-containing protein [Tatlockia sp.]|nr:DUF2188 domain-containing protein [Tatlockia sp.]
MVKPVNKSREHHVLPHSGGGWDIRRSKGLKASRHFLTQKEAIDAARAISLHQKTELIIHKKNGQISRRDSHGHDPRSSRG